MAANAPKPYTNKPFADSSINYHLAPGDVLVQCPYYPHKVLEAKLPGHLGKCMTQYKKEMARNPRLPKYLICKDNWKHHVREGEFEEHCAQCPDARDRLERESKAEEGQDATSSSSMADSSSDVTVTVGRQPPRPRREPVEAIDVDESMSEAHSAASSIVAGSSSSKRSRTFVESALFSSRSGTLGSSSSLFSSLDNVDVRAKPAGPNSTFTRTAARRRDNWEAELLETRRTIGGAPVSTSVLRSGQGEVPHLYYIPPGMSKSERTAYRQAMVSRAPVKDHAQSVPLADAVKPTSSPVGMDVPAPDVDVHALTDKVIEDDFAHVEPGITKLPARARNAGWTKWDEVDPSAPNQIDSAIYDYDVQGPQQLRRH